MADLLGNGVQPSVADLALRGVELIAYEDDGVRGVMMLKGSEFHFLSLPNFRLRRPALRAALGPLMDKLGYLTTRVAHSDKANQRFNHLFGFMPTWADADFQYYMLTELPFGERKKTCQL